MTGASTGGAVSEGAGELGAFAYATIDDTVRTNPIQTSGNAYYEGATRAGGGDATLYSGDFEMQVRFRSKKVSGLVSNLRDSDGATWQFKYGDVDSIILPEATLGTQANWTAKSTSITAGGNGAQITFAPRAGSPSPVTVIGGFQGTLLGTGDAAGEQAVGTWSVGADPGEKGGYLAGGFGAARVEDAPSTLPDSDDGTMTETTVVPTGTGQTLGANDDGMLTLKGEGADGDDPLKDTFEISLATMFGEQDAKNWANGAKQVDLARAEIERLMSQLNAFIALDNDDASIDDTKLANTNRAEIWVAVNAAIELYLFDNAMPVLDETPSDNATEAKNWPATTDNTGGNMGYPVSSGGNALDSEALSEIQEVLDALASQDALEDALEKNGVFEYLNAKDLKADGTPTAIVAVGDIWGRKEARVQWMLSSTEYTRFGVWRKQGNAYAKNGYGNKNRNNEDGPGRFAYSPLEQTSYASADDPSYPGGGVATYTGETLAVQNADFYAGTVSVRVEWTPNTIGESSVAAVISDLENVANGDPLVYKGVLPDPIDATKLITKTSSEIRDIVFLANVSADSEDHTLSFTSSDMASARPKLTFADRNLADVLLYQAAATAATLEGKFVGQDIDGPLGVLGTWTLQLAGPVKVNGEYPNSNSIHYQIGNGLMIHGAFGAEVGP